MAQLHNNTEHREVTVTFDFGTPPQFEQTGVTPGEHMSANYADLSYWWWYVWPADTEKITSDWGHGVPSTKPPASCPASDERGK